MKTIGLIGGMSWESSLAYYRILNETVRERLGGLHSARSILYSVEFAEVAELQRRRERGKAAALMVAAAQSLERAGADFLILCANTQHMHAEEIQRHIQIPLLHIADATAERVKAAGLSKVGLLGTRFTMEEDFYKRRLAERHGLQVVIPPEADRELVHRVIYDELCQGELRDESRQEYLRVIEELVGRGAEGAILGCTEIGLLVRQRDTAVPLFDTTRIHAVAAVDLALQP